jgi:glucosamine--fructose-6-phosphate aminotransferase (isomerizing)
MCVAVTGVGSSLLANEADLVIVTGEGPESTFAKTKSVMATAVVLMQVALALETEPHEKRPRLERALAQMPELLALVIREAERDLERLAAWLVQHELVLVTGTAGNQGVAQEAVLKLQEAAGVTTEWDETGNALNGAVSILGPTRLMVGLVTRADYELNLALLKLARHFGADRLCIAEPGLALEGCSEAVIRVPQAGDPLIAPLLFLPPIHLLAYHLAVERGRNPDEPPFADVMLKAMLPSGREEPDWGLAAVGERSSREG